MDTNHEKESYRPYDGVKAVAVKAAAHHFKVTESYVRMCVNGAKKYGKSKEIKSFFEEKYEELRKIITPPQ